MFWYRVHSAAKGTDRWDLGCCVESNRVQWSCHRSECFEDLSAQSWTYVSMTNKSPCIDPTSPIQYLSSLTVDLYLSQNFTLGWLITRLLLDDSNNRSRIQDTDIATAVGLHNNHVVDHREHCANNL